MNGVISSAEMNLRWHSGRRSPFPRAAEAVFLALSLLSFSSVVGQGTNSSTKRPATNVEFREAIAQAKTELKKEEHANEGALVYRLESKDSKLALARTEIHNTTPGYAGHRPGRATEGETVTAFGRHQKMFELRITAPGYHELVRSGVFRRATAVCPRTGPRHPPALHRRPDPVPG